LETVVADVCIWTSGAVPQGGGHGGTEATKILVGGRHMPVVDVGVADIDIISGEEWMTVQVVIASRACSVDPRAVIFGGACTDRCSDQRMHHRPDE